MSKQLHGEFLIFSVAPDCIVPAVIEFLAPMYGYANARGQWKGESEDSIVMRLPDKWLDVQAHTGVLVQMLNALYNMGEESVLYIDAERNAVLISTSPVYGLVEQHLGKLVVATEEVAMQIDHTQIDGTYYAVDKDVNNCLQKGI